MYSVGIIGFGYVGSAIASGFSLCADIKVYDLDERKATHTFAEVVNSDFVFVCVPTPMKKVKGWEIVLTIMDSVFRDISKANERTDNIFIIKSTIIPGTTQRYINEHDPQMKNCNLQNILSYFRCCPYIHVSI